MKIGIIGSGDIGSTAARRFTEGSHAVAISNSRRPESLTGLVGDLGANARAATGSERATFGDIVLEAIPFGEYRELPAATIGDKIVRAVEYGYHERDDRRDHCDSARCPQSTFQYRLQRAEAWLATQFVTGVV